MSSIPLRLGYLPSNTSKIPCIVHFKAFSVPSRDDKSDTTRTTFIPAPSPTFETNVQPSAPGMKLDLPPSYDEVMNKH